MEAAPASFRAKALYLRGAVLDHETESYSAAAEEALSKAVSLLAAPRAPESFSRGCS